MPVPAVAAAGPGAAGDPVNVMDLFFGKPKAASPAVSPNLKRKAKKARDRTKARRSSSEPMSRPAEPKAEAKAEAEAKQPKKTSDAEAEELKRHYLRSLNEEDKHHVLPPKPITAYKTIDVDAPPLTDAEKARKKHFVAWVMNGSEDFGKSKNLLDLEKYAMGWQQRSSSANGGRGQTPKVEPKAAPATRPASAKAPAKPISPKPKKKPSI